MGIAVKNLPKELDSLEPEGGDVVISDDSECWLVTEELTVVSLGDGMVRTLDDIRIVKVFSNCTLTLG